MLFPLFVTVAVWTPAVYTRAVSLVSLAVACGAVVCLAHIARALGRNVERALFANWGGQPATRWLSHSDGNLDAQTKARYHGFLTRHMDAWVAPSPTDELQDNRKADIAYESAVRWLREKTRDRKRYRLVFEENVSYGFRRNLYGLKPVGLVVGSLCLVSNYLALNGVISNTTAAIGPGLGGLALSLAVLICWIVVVRPTWVRDSAEAYARALLATCDQSGGGDAP